MRGSGPTLTIDFLKKGNPACSLCGMQFGSEGMVRPLIELFTLHVRRQHLHALADSSTDRKPIRQHSLRGAAWNANYLCGTTQVVLADRRLGTPP
jgi:hypothetical protein